MGWAGAWGVRREQPCRAVPCRGARCARAHPLAAAQHHQSRALASQRLTHSPVTVRQEPSIRLRSSRYLSTAGVPPICRNKQGREHMASRTMVGTVLWLQTVPPRCKADCRCHMQATDAAWESVSPDVHRRQIVILVRNLHHLLGPTASNPTQCAWALLPHINNG